MIRTNSYHTTWKERLATVGVMFAFFIFVIAFVVCISFFPIPTVIVAGVLGIIAVALWVIYGD